MNNKKVLIIIVLYHPDIPILQALVQHCLEYPGSDIFLSDNTDTNTDRSDHDRLANLLKQHSQRIFYYHNQQNVGIASAQNQGIQFALRHSAYQNICLFDQDSEINNQFINQLVTAFFILRQNNQKIAAVGPSLIDPRISNIKNKRTQVSTNSDKKMIIASGSMINIDAIKAIGLMDESLFIDHVDTEWCYRAWHKGYKVMQLSDMVMNHAIGETKPIFGGAYQLQYQNPMRYYYIFRNSIILFKKKYIPLKDRLYILFRNMPYIIKILFLENKWQHVQLIIKGILDGLKHISSGHAIN